MLLRRICFAAIALLIVAGLAALLASTLAPGGWSVAKVLLMACFAGVAPWLGISAGNALVGCAIQAFAAHPARFVFCGGADPARGEPALPAALVVTIRDEPMALVLPPLRRLLDGLDGHGVGGSIGLFILSDTEDPRLVAHEAAAVAAFRAADPVRIRYRRRARNDGFKAGNVMDFLDHHADGFVAAVVLDADSEMTAGAVLRLLRLLAAHPGVGIVQHLTVGRPAEAAFARLFQFGMRAGMRLWATGQAWWQGDEGPYWGHNAALRIAPFRAHARIAALPNGNAILSHDQLEAVQLRAAGWGVCVWAEEDGSSERTPPAMPEFLRRDDRWLAGNMQYRHLLGRPGLRPMGRWQLLQAMLLFTGAPLYVALLALAAVMVAAGDGAVVSQGRLAALVGAWSVALYAPKLLGYAQVLASARARAGYGGAARFALGAGGEVLFTLLLDAPAQVSKTLALARLLLGAPAGWAPQNRAERGVGWAEAGRLLWPHTLFGIAVFAALAAGSWGAVLWALPFAGGLLTAIPFCVLTASPRVSASLRRHGIAATREEYQAESGASSAARYQSEGSRAAASYHSATSG